jgi:hypothetical protein
MHANLAEHGVDVRDLPVVMQYNKQDLPPSLAASVSELSVALNFRGVPEFAADALHGTGVFDTLRSLGMRVLRRLGADEGTTSGQRAQAALKTPHASSLALTGEVMRPATPRQQVVTDDLMMPVGVGG